MRTFKYIFLFIFISCSSTKVVYDYDSAANFAKYTSFNYFEDAGNGLNGLDIKRVQQVLDQQLKLKRITQSASPAILVNFFVEKQPVQNRNTIGVGIGGGGNIGFDISGGIPITTVKIKEVFTLDFVDAEKNELLWQGVISSEVRDNLKPKEKERHYQHIISKLLSKYPPKK